MISDETPYKSSRDTTVANGETKQEPTDRILLSDRTRESFLKNNPPRRILVNSIPKCGTTWVRTIMAALPGYEEYPRKGNDGTKPEQLLGVEPGQVFHGHLTANKKVFEILNERDFTVIYVYRDLRDAVISNYFHLKYLNPKRAPKFFEDMEKEELLLAENLEKWCNSAKRYHDVRHWLKIPRTSNVTYEALKADTSGELHRILSEMKFSFNQELIDFSVRSASFERMSGRKVGQEDPGSPQRKGIVGDWKNHFSDRVKASFKEKYGPLLIEYGYEQNDEW